MSAGLKFYSKNGGLMIDASYSNIALTEKISKNTTEKTSSHNGNNVYEHSYSQKNPIIVLPLSSRMSGVYRALWSNDTNSFNMTLVTAGDTSLDAMIFDKPSTINTSGPALRIYSDQDGSKVFDSRLKYLKVIGVAEDGMLVPEGAKWGILMRERQIHVETVYTNPGTGSGYLFVLLSGWDISDNKLRKNSLVVYSEYYNNLSAAPHIDVDPIRGVEPLLIDLKNY